MPFDTSTVRWKVLENIKTCLSGISVTNQNLNTIAHVEHWNGDEEQETAARPCITIVPGNETYDHNPNPLVTAKLEVFLELIISLDSRSNSESIASLIGDVIQSLMTDVTRGGYARNTVLVGSYPFQVNDSAAECGVIIEFGVEYRFYEADPTKHSG
jgi:hypothetical protein